MIYPPLTRKANPCNLSPYHLREEVECTPPSGTKGKYQGLQATLAQLEQQVRVHTSQSGHHISGLRNFTVCRKKNVEGFI